jgi:Co/Zn/Cd efflux system component
MWAGGEVEIMGVVGFPALATHVAGVLLLVRYKDGDANGRSGWLFYRNDGIGNVPVMLVALALWGGAWPLHWAPRFGPGVVLIAKDKLGD